LLPTVVSFHCWAPATNC